MKYLYLTTVCICVSISYYRAAEQIVVQQQSNARWPPPQQLARAVVALMRPANGFRRRGSNKDKYKSISILNTPRFFLFVAIR